ncbi:hypothetical protein IAD21_00430 [Abditibacteriota bacterium]|nr:hypothetical protein IAD21_00430 [Abditibacteriota bacterium]
MRKTELRFIKTEGVKDSLQVAQFIQSANDWLFNAEYPQHSKPTIATRRIVTIKLLWFLNQRRIFILEPYDWFRAPYSANAGPVDSPWKRGTSSG